MKNKKSVIITLPQPCEEDWEQMKPVGCGRFCNQCQKTVIDFTLLPDEQLARLLATDRPLCGRFLPEQLNRPIPIPAQPKHNRLYGKLATAAVFLVPYFSVLPATAQKGAKMVMAGKDEVNATGKPISIKGTITDAQTGKPLSRMEISIDGLDKQYSDWNGRFSFTLPDTYAGKKVIVKAAYFPLSSAEQNNSIILEETVTIDPFLKHYKVALLRYPMGIIENDSNGVVVEQRISSGHGGAPVSYTIYTSRPSIWKRITHIFKHKRNY